MYLTSSQIKSSLESLSTVHPFFGIAFLAFKRADLPVGRTGHFVFTQIAEEILFSYYKPSSTFKGFYHPFQTSDKSKRWLTPRYASTSLQRIAADTFGHCFLHRKTTSEWGWRDDYVKRLRRHLVDQKLPTFHLATWLFHNFNWPESVTPEMITGKFFKEFSITPEEQSELFDSSLPPGLEDSWLQNHPVTQASFLELIGAPPGAIPEDGAALDFLEIQQIGPSRHICYQPGPRLNILTGDNSLGKTFLLEAVWWALTGHWLDRPALPRRAVSKSAPRLAYGLSTGRGKIQKAAIGYNWETQNWDESRSRNVLAGLVVYARYDGSFAVWDPARALMEKATRSTPGLLLFRRNQIWDGLSADSTSDRASWICNGLIRDWVTWQTGGRYTAQFAAFSAALRSLSPSQEESLVPGEPVRLPPDAREVPTLRMPFEEVPVTHASAGVQRILALAYLLVWTWFEHLTLSEVVRNLPQRRLVLIVDEVEAHLHPRWQRLIVPALMRVISDLAVSATLQVHLATHSPMILASAETVFDETTDNLHHLKLVGSDVELEELPFNRRGRADLWLISDSFGLKQARSAPAEEAIETAKSLQATTKPALEEVQAVHTKLVKFLAEDDEFWPRWIYFAEQNGVRL